MASVPSESVKRSLLSSSVLFAHLCLLLCSFLHHELHSSVPPLPHSESLVDTFKRHNWRQNSLLWQKHGYFRSTDWSVHKMKLHAKIKDTLIFRQTNFTLGHTHTHLDTCTYLYHPASVSAKLTFYLTMRMWNNCSSIYPVRQTDKQTVRSRNTQTDTNESRRQEEATNTRVKYLQSSHLQHWNTDRHHWKHTQ